jgi:hypothetical protein
MQSAYLAILASSYVQPITDLLHKLLSCPHPGSNTRQADLRENRCAVSLCLLLVVFLESFISRARYLARYSMALSKIRAIDFLKERYPCYPGLPAVTEIFVLRDAIAHNHLLIKEYSKNCLSLWQEANGGAKLAKFANPGEEITKVLGLKVIPTKIDRSDVMKVLNTVLDTLEFMDGEEKGQLGLIELRAHFRGKEDLTLWEIRDQVSMTALRDSYGEPDEQQVS